VYKQVLVVGAGPTGLAFAAVCLRLGLSVRLVEKKSGPSITSKAIGLQYRVSEILACMGVADRFLRRSGSPTTVNMYAQSRRLVSLQFKTEGHESGCGAFQPRPLMIAQSETEEILGDVVRERGGDIEWNTELTGLTQNAERVVAQLRLPDGTEQFAACDWLVSCEGAHSIARNAIGAEFAGKTYPLAFVMADVELRGAIAPGENHVWMHPDGSFAALPFPQKDRWRLFVEVTRQPRRSSANVDLAMIRELMKERIGDIALHIDNPTWISPFGINCRLVDRYRRGRVLLAGDAAHIHSPTGGQGIATGIQDAINLAWKLARVIAGAPADLLDTYEHERRAHAEEVLHETNRTTSIFFAPTPFARILRDGIVLPLLRSAWVQRRMFAKLSQLHVHYRRSRLSRDDRPLWSLHTGLRPGERAPDFLLRHHAGTPRTSLFELLSSGRPLALVSPGEAACVRIDALLALLGSFSVEGWIVVDPQTAPWQGHSRALTDTHRELERLYGLRGEFLCLIRPDDHIGLIQAPIDETALRAYLRYISPPPRIQLQAQPSAQSTLHNA
jgi:2-polyprenyl-6-methoxyphenol hydroxylase-like FAD-dependent oxidoreductase